MAWCVGVTADARAAWEISGSYSYLQDPPDRTDFPAGWAAGTAIDVRPWLSIAADVSGHHTSSFAVDLSTLAALGGVRASARLGSLTEFAQLLAGAVRASSTVVGLDAGETDPAIQPGAGVEYPLAPRYALRAQFDYRLVRGGAGPPIADPRHQFRYSLGIVFHHR